MLAGSSRHGLRSVAMSHISLVRLARAEPSASDDGWIPPSPSATSETERRSLLLHSPAPTGAPATLSGFHVLRSGEGIRPVASEILQTHLRTRTRRGRRHRCCPPSPCLSRYGATRGYSSLATDDVEARSQQQENGDGTGVRFQATYLTPALPVVFAHGLFGFDELLLAPESLRKTLPGLTITYWHGVADMLTQRGVEVLVTRVPMSASIEERARSLRDAIDAHFAEGQEINLIGHSMGGLDARHLITHLDTKVRVRSLTTIASPHRGSTFADHMLDHVIGRHRLPLILRTLQQLGVPGGGRAFECLTRDAMQEFNERTPNDPFVKYLSWGAAFLPGWFHEFRLSHSIIFSQEGDNDGLVSIDSSKWGEYQGTLKASHLDLIGWTRKANAIVAAVMHVEQPFDARAFYLTLCEDLAKLGF